MSWYVGHDTARHALEAALPPVVLLRGPASVGKRSLAVHLARHHGVAKIDTRAVTRLTAEVARDLRDWAFRAPSGPGKAAIIRLDDATDAALNVLLKVLEEPPAPARFLLTATRPTLDTIASRAACYPLGYLSAAELTKVLVERLGMDPRLAPRAVARGRGSVRAALASVQAEPERAWVLGVLKALIDRDADLLDQALTAWDQAAHDLLKAWAIEAVTGRWRVFTGTEAPGLLGGDIPLRLVRGLGLAGRPRLAARAVLSGFVSP